VFCSRCGAAIAADAAFCQACGNPATQAITAAPPPGFVSPHAAVGAIVYATNVVYAGFWLRFVAYLIDRVILGIFTTAVLVPFFFLLGGAALLDSLIRTRGQGIEPGQLGGFVMIALFISVIAGLVQWLYYAYLESGEKQATWGKQALGLYVTDLQGNRTSFGRASGRFFAKFVTGLTMGIGYIMAGFTERKQALHDMIASCLVLRR
jgi:uncharacterized RDD family membrane protein YckC